jgi:TolB protein
MLSANNTRASKASLITPKGISGLPPENRTFSLYIRIALTALALLLALAGGASARIYIAIDTPGVEPIPVAIPAFKVTDKARPGYGEPSPHLILPDILRRNLKIVGEFELLDPRGYLEDSQLVRLVPNSDSFASWQTAGAELLIKGQVDRAGLELVVEFHAYDVIRREFLFGKRYRGSMETINSMAHMFANALLEHLTGEKGPFGTEIAYVVRSGKSKNIASVEVDGSNPRWLTKNSSLNLNPIWSRDGNSIYMTTYYGGNPDLCRFHIPTGKLRYVYRDEGMELPGPEDPKSETMLFTSSTEGNMDLYTMDMKTRKTKRITTNRAIDVSPTWSPDSSKIAFVSDRKGNPHIFVMDANGGTPRRITFRGSHSGDPAWSPKGDKIAYTSMDKNGNFQVHIVDPEGKKPQQITFGDYDTHDPSWSPDGRFLAVTSNKDGKEAVFVLRLGVNRLWRISPEGQQASQPYWSHGPVIR